MRLSSFFTSSWLLIGYSMLGHQLVHSEEGKLPVIQLRREVISSVHEMWDTVEKVGSLNVEENILQRMGQLSRQISTSQHEVFSTANITVATLIEQLPMQNQTTVELVEMLNLTTRIHQQEITIQAHLETDAIKEQQSKLEEMARRMVAQDANSVLEILTRLDLLIAGPRDLPFVKPGLLEQLLQAFEKAKPTVCSVGLSAQQVLHHLYNAYALNELKGYTMVQFSWMLLKMYGKGNFNAEANLMRRSFENRTGRTQKLLQQVMAQASREYWRCDPERNQQEEAETFLQFTRLLQGYIVNEVDLTTLQTCKRNCGYYKWGVRQEQCYDTDHCPSQIRCSGKIYDCEFISNELVVFPANESSARRFEYIEYTNGTGMVMGQKNQNASDTTKVKSWWRWFYHCSYCFCICDDAGPRSDRFINLRESVSDIRNNKVVTGLRFVKKKRVVYLIVQQGKLLPWGEIDNATLQWVEPEVYDVSSTNAVDGRDYISLNHKNRIIDLDDLFMQPPYVLTGVRFRTVRDHVNLEARMTKMDFVTGKLVNLDESIWIGNDNTEDSKDKRTELKLENPHDPLRSPLKSIPDSTTNQFVRFRESDRTKDAAQTTVPFFDGQPVESTAKTVLGGCGLFHKGQPGYGGYVAPKVVIYDYGSHV